jgi:transglutaminase-like putative cysteine protease
MLSVRHSTVYRYVNPVNLGDHRMMVRPRDSHDIQLLNTRLTITPRPTALRWLHDVFENSVAIASFDSPTTSLEITSEINLRHFERSEPDCAIEAYAATYPFRYSVDKVADLARVIERHFPDPNRDVDSWARRFLRAEGPTNTFAMLSEMTRTINAEFLYRSRYIKGVQSPVETLRLGSGSCRDFALLMIEAARSLGLAARFVSGYLYHSAVGRKSHVGGGATHAWVQIFLPGCGWIEFDPTNGIVGNRDLIRVAVVRDPSQAVPISGTWFGSRTDYLGMTVQVSVISDDI